MKKIYSLSLKGKILSEKVKVADKFFDRFIGLMFKGPDQEFDVLAINRCNSIHTCFMKYSIDVVFLSKDNTVVKIIRNIKPWRMTMIYFKARMVLEFEAGKLSSSIKEGDHIEVVCIN